MKTGIVKKIIVGVVAIVASAAMTPCASGYPPAGSGRHQYRCQRRLGYVVTRSGTASGTTTRSAPTTPIRTLLIRYIVKTGMNNQIRAGFVG